VRASVIDADAVFGDAQRPSEPCRRWVRRARAVSIPRGACGTTTASARLLRVATARAPRQGGRALGLEPDAHDRPHAPARCRYVGNARLPWRNEQVPH